MSLQIFIIRIGRLSVKFSVVKQVMICSLLMIIFSSCQEKEVRDEKKNIVTKPNIIIIVADDLGWNDVSLHNSDIHTSSIDQLAKEGLEFTRFYTAPVCSPTRAGLLTGMYPDRFGLRNFVYSPRHKGGVDPETKMLPEYLQENGYTQRAAFGKWHLGHSQLAYHPNQNGFNLFYGHYNGAIDYFTHKRDGELDWHQNNMPSFEEGYSTDLIETQAIQFIESSKDQPFFAYIAFNAPHSPMQSKYEELREYGYDSTKVSEDYIKGGAREGENELENYGVIGRGNTLRQTYSGMVSSLDKSIGKIMEVLREKNLDKNTLVWFLSDNGGSYEFGGNNQPLRGAKHEEWEGGVRVVSILKWPDNIEPNSKSDKLVAYIDVVPTILNIVGDFSKTTLDGIDVSKAFTNNELPDRSIFLGNTGIVTQNWKLNKGELFKIEEDMSESHNVAQDYPEIVKELNMQIEEYNKMKSSQKPELQPLDWRPPKNWTISE